MGTPGVGAGSLASYGSEQLPEGVAPVAEFEFAPANPGDAPQKVTLNLTDQNGARSWVNTSLPGDVPLVSAFLMRA